MVTGYQYSPEDDIKQIINKVYNFYWFVPVGYTISDSQYFVCVKKNENITYVTYKDYLSSPLMPIQYRLGGNPTVCSCSGDKLVFIRETEYSVSLEKVKSLDNSKFNDLLVLLYRLHKGEAVEQTIIKLF